MESLRPYQTPTAHQNIRHRLLMQLFEVGLKLAPFFHETPFSTNINYDYLKFAIWETS